MVDGLEKDWRGDGAGTSSRPLPVRGLRWLGGSTALPELANGDRRLTGWCVAFAFDPEGASVVDLRPFWS